MSSNKPYYHAIAFISDIHGNLEALEAILEDIKRQQVSSIYCLGDIVGYGPDPMACTRRLMNLVESKQLIAAVAGNHDYGVCDQDISNFSSSAKEVMEWTINEMQGTEEANYIRELCQKELIKKIGRFWLVHSTLNPSPEKWEYLKTKNAGENFQDRKIVFVGHSHVPAIYSRYSAGKDWHPISLFGNDGHYFLPPAQKTMLPAGKSSKSYRLEVNDPFPTMIINAGSVGQPRDNNPNARYALYITIDYKSYIEYRQVGYDVQKTVDKHKKRGLSCDERLATRLCTGGNTRFDHEFKKPDWFPTFSS